MTTESKVVCELVDSLLSQPVLLEAISKNLDIPRNLPANTNYTDAFASARNDCSGNVSRSNCNTRFQSQAQEVDDEVRHIFSRGRSSAQLERSNSATHNDQHLPRRDVNSIMHSPMYHFTRNFARQNSQRMQQPKYSKRNFRGPSTFTKEIILLPGPREEIVVKQGTKQFLYESGHIITTFEFNKMWTSNEVQENLHRAFSPKIDNVDIQLRMPCHNKLVKPLLMNEQTLSGLLISKIFKQKSVYLLPSKQILEVPEQSLQDKGLEEKSDLIAWLENGNDNSAGSECAIKVDSLDLLQVDHTITTAMSANTEEEITLQTTATSIQHLPENNVEITSSFQATSREFQIDFQPTTSQDDTSQSFSDHYRLKDGLKQLGVLHAMEIHKQIFEEAFIWIKKIITADSVDAIFNISFSPAGRNYRTVEKKVIGYWRDYLQDCEELACEAKLQDILCFVTGADVVPPLGFSPQPSIEFLHNCDQEKQLSKFPEANPCGNVLRLPLL